MAMRFPATILLSRDHRREEFESSSPELNNFLRTGARQQNTKGGARTWVLTTADDPGQIVGYYSLAPTAVATIDVPESLRGHLGRYPVPGILLARLAVDRRFEGQGIGGLLFMDAAVKTMQAVDYAGGHLFVIDAKDVRATDWYARFGVQALPSQPLRLFLTVKELKRLHLTLEAEARQP